jgi:hypothetical protein
MNLIKMICLSVVLTVLFVFSYGCSDSQKKTLETSFSDMIGSSYPKTRMTAIILIADFKETSLLTLLDERLKNSVGVEKSAILYCLSLYKKIMVDEFIDSLPGDEIHIKELLNAESPEFSYFREPHFQMIRYLGSLACINKKALAKLKMIQPYADGWQGEEIMELVNDAEKSQ